MSEINIKVESQVSRSARAQQIESLFDVPASQRQALEWKGVMPIEDRKWNVGLIVGPSGCGKSTILRDKFGQPKTFEWGKPSVIDDFDSALRVQDISLVCQAVGFNTIPAWLRPFGVLSNGEQFRVDMARRLMETVGETIVVDEFTSVVDRQVAKIGAHAVQKYVRAHEQQFVAASCHFDVVDWLQPDWILQPATMAFTWRELQRRPALECTIARVSYEAWSIFAPFHYLTADLNRAAKCFGLFIDGQIAAFAATLHRPHARVHDITGVSRLVTLPDYQGLGLAFILVEQLGAMYRSIGRVLHTYPAHPALVRGFDKSPKWVLEKPPGQFSPKRGSTSSAGVGASRPCAVFRYAGEGMDQKEAEEMLG